jgi:hypothetical protein
MSYRIAFYEDLFYASDWNARIAGIARFRSITAPLRTRRLAHTIKDMAEYKLDLVRLYKSQFHQPPVSITQFTPAGCFAQPPHEAIWI